MNIDKDSTSTLDVNLNKQHFPLTGVGLGLRRELIPALKERKPDVVNFLEFAPENWMNIGGLRRQQLEFFVDHYSLVCHGLYLSLGSLAPLNIEFIHALKQFMNMHKIAYYSEHLSYCSDTQGQLYDLLPIPFTEAAVHHVSRRIKQVQELLDRRIAIENISCYSALATELSESEFINAVVSEADCDLLLDVNNIYVNSVNHCYDPFEFSNCCSTNLPNPRHKQKSIMY